MKTITFVAGDGDVDPEQMIVAKGEYAEEPTVRRRGEDAVYEFMGWYIDGETAEEFDFESPVETDLILYARWKEYKNHYDAITELSDKTTGIGDILLKDEEYVGKSLTFETATEIACYMSEKTGESCVVIYDYVDNEFSLVDEEGADIIVTRSFTADEKFSDAHVYYIGEEPTAYYVDFFAIGCSVESQMVFAREKVIRPADPVKEGYTFVGWFTEDGAEYDFSLSVEGDMTLFARFTRA